LSAHPLDEYSEILTSMRIKKLAEFGEFRAGSSVVLAGIVSAAQVRWSKKGNRFCSFRLEDPSMGVKCLVWSDAYSKHSAHIVDDAIIIVEGKVETADGNDVTVIVNEVRPIEEQVARVARSVSITLPADLAANGLLDDLFAMLSESPGRTEVFFDLTVDGVHTKLSAPALSVQGSVGLTRRIEQKGCHVDWKMN
jgi:DNA polymerase-3 subunit alpha